MAKVSLTPTDPTSKTCSIPGCDRPPRHWGWCNMHYCRWRAHGDPTYIVYEHQQETKRWAREYRSYTGAKSRCRNSNHRYYHLYGGRGIEFRFSSFDQFKQELGVRPPKTSLDRIDNNGHYEPGNVRWATIKEQANNMRTNRWITIGKRTLTLTQWAELCGIPPSRVTGRLVKHWCVPCALILPLGGSCAHRPQ